jgi:hypothetical protein
MARSCGKMNGGKSRKNRSTRRKTMKGGNGLVAAAKSLLLPALFFIGQKFQQNRVITKRNRAFNKANKTVRRR